MGTRTNNLQGRAEGAELLIPSAKISLAPHQVNSYVWGTKEFTWGALRKYRLIYKKQTLSWNNMGTRTNNLQHAIDVKEGQKAGDLQAKKEHKGK